MCSQIASGQVWWKNVCECTQRRVWLYSDNSRKQTSLWGSEGRKLLVPNNLSVQTSSSAWQLSHCHEFSFSPSFSLPPFQCSSTIFVFSLSYPFFYRHLVVVADWVFSQEIKLHHILLVIYLGVKFDMFHPQWTAANRVCCLAFLLFVTCPQSKLQGKHHIMIITKTLTFGLHLSVGWNELLLFI